MECSNPYESPEGRTAFKPRRASYGSRRQAVRGEMWRGARLAFKIVLMAYYGFLAALIVTVISWLVVWGGSDEVARFCQRLQTLEGLEVLKVLGALLYIVLVAPAIVFLCCAVFASPMMGICAAIQWRPPAVQEVMVKEPSEASVQTRTTTKEQLSIIPSGIQREA